MTVQAALLPPPEGRDRDARVAAEIASGRCDSADVREWLVGFRRRAVAYCLRWRHTPEDADDFVQEFLLYALRTDLFAGYSPDRGSLGGYVFTCFKHEFYDEGKRRAAQMQREGAMAPDHPASGETSAVDAVAATEALRRAERCLASLGTVEGQAGWLVRQVYLEERSYKELAEQLFANEPPERRGRQIGRLRKRVWDAMAKLRRCMDEADPRDGSSNDV